MNLISWEVDAVAVGDRCAFCDGPATYRIDGSDGHPNGGDMFLNHLSCWACATREDVRLMKARRVASPTHARQFIVYAESEDHVREVMQRGNYQVQTLRPHVLAAPSSPTIDNRCAPGA